MVDAYHSGKIQKIIIPRDFIGSTSVVPLFLIRYGINIDDLLISRRIDWAQIEDEISNPLQLLQPYCQARYLPYLDFSIVDHCNLNCRGCNRYSSLVRKEKFTNFEQWTRDFDRVKTFIDDIGVVCIVGGEPLLNPEIVLYMERTRRMYPFARIFVITNAIKLMSMPNDFFDACRNFNIEISITVYPPIKKYLHKIYDFLAAEGIKFNDEVQIGMGKHELIEDFVIHQRLNPQKDRSFFYICYEASCNTLYEGKIAACPYSFFTKYFNEYFATNLPKDGTIDIYDPNLTTTTLKHRLLIPFERCRYCGSYKRIPWTKIKNPSTLDDWIVN